MLLTAQTALAAPLITSISGTYNSGQSVVINGSSFGTKTIASPNKFNNMESETIGTIPSDEMISTGTTPHGLVKNNLAHDGTKSLEFDYSATSVNGSHGMDWQRNILDLGATADKIYLTAWVYLDYGTSNSTQWQWKSFTITSSPKGYYDLNPTYPSTNLPYSADAYNTTTVFMNYWWNGTAAYFDPANGKYGWFNNHGQAYNYDNVTTFRNQEAVSPTGAPTDALLWNQWQRLEFYAQRSSAPSTADGIWREQRIGRSGYTFNYNNVMTHLAGNDSWRYVTLSSALESVYDGTANLKIYMDDVYVDTTQARVELCDSSTWSARTHCEIQPATAWSDTGATITLNQGSFTNGTTAYLYVVDSAGNTSNGQQVTIGSGSVDTTPPAAPTGLSVI